MLEKWREIISCNFVIDSQDSKENKRHPYFWHIVTMTMFACTIFFIYQTVVGYIETPTVTNIDIVQQLNMELPEVLVGYRGGLNVTAMKMANLSEEFMHTFSSFIKMKAEMISEETINRSKDELSNYVKNKHMDYIDFARNFGYQCNNIIMSITPPDRSYYGCENSTPFMTDKLSTFVLKNISQQWYPGLSGGLTLKLKQPRDSYFIVYPKRALNLDMNENFLISLEKTIGHNYDSGRSYKIPLNCKVEILLNPILYKRINGNSKCSELTFTSNTCFDQCLIDGHFATCKCIPYLQFGDGLKYNQSQVCNPFSSTTGCLNITAIKECSNKCLPSCNEWVYEATISYDVFQPTVLNDSIVVIGFNNLQYTKIEEINAFTIDMAISNVGGQAGLWLGISIMNIIQVVYYSILAVFGKKQTSSSEVNLKQNRRNLDVGYAELKKRVDTIETKLDIN